MPNWCSNRISITCNSEAKINNLYNLLIEWTSKVSKENSWKTKWLGNIVNFSGIGSDENINCRGSIDDIELYNNTISFWTETAWNPSFEMWFLICEKYLGEEDIDWSILYVSEEPGADIFCTNDPSIVDSYNIEVWEDNEWLEEEAYEVSESYVVELLQRILNIENESNVDTLIEMFNDEYDNPPLVFRKFEYADIHEF